MCQKNEGLNFYLWFKTKTHTHTAHLQSLKLNLHKFVFRFGCKSGNFSPKLTHNFLFFFEVLV